MGIERSPDTPREQSWMQRWCGAARKKTRNSLVEKLLRVGWLKQRPTDAVNGDNARRSKFRLPKISLQKTYLLELAKQRVDEEAAK